MALAAPAQAVFSGLTAVVLWGGHEFADGQVPVEVTVPPGTRWQPGRGVMVRGRDRRRLDRLTAAGWRVFFVTTAGMRAPDELLARLATAVCR